MDEERKPETPLLKLIEEGFRLMRAYINDIEGEIIIDKQSVNQHIYGIPTYSIVVQTYDNLDELLKQLWAVNGLKLPRLVAEYNDLMEMCERKKRV